MSVWGTDKITLIGTRELKELRELNAELLAALEETITHKVLGQNLIEPPEGFMAKLRELIAKAEGSKEGPLHRFRKMLDEAEEQK